MDNENKIDKSKSFGQKLGHVLSTAIVVCFASLLVAVTVKIIMMLF